MTEFKTVDFDTMTPADFETYLPEFFANGDGHVSTDPRLQTFLANNPDCAALVRDLEAIADQARSLFEPTDDQDPSDAVWSNIQNKLKQAVNGEDDRPVPHTV
jgi:anti-sigma factor RsiW